LIIYQGEMASYSLRRSQRGKSPLYKNGDSVEIMRNEGVSRGFLLRKIEDSGPSNIWIVRFDNGAKDQAIPEKMFDRPVPDVLIKEKRLGIHTNRNPLPNNQSDNSSSLSNSDVDYKTTLSDVSTLEIKNPFHKVERRGSKKKEFSRKHTTGSVKNKDGKRSKYSVHDQNGISTRSTTKGKRGRPPLDSLPNKRRKAKKRNKGRSCQSTIFNWYIVSV